MTLLKIFSFFFLFLTKLTEHVVFSEIAFLITLIWCELFWYECISGYRLTSDLNKNLFTVKRVITLSIK